MMSPTILLFDIDGTLLSAGGAGKRALEQAISQAVGTAYKLAFSLDGRTDRAIVRQSLIDLHCSDSDIEKTITQILDNYVERLKIELNDTSACYVYPGILDVLNFAYAKQNTIALGLGTGNIQRGAKIKLASVNLDGYFSFGGFGSDHEERPEIIRIGAMHGAAKLGYDVKTCRVVVIGDTPRDIAAAHTVGAISIAVATGKYSIEQLQSAGATYAFANLADANTHKALFEE
ncbi:MAG: HAD hydrolase-like protein [Deltaproteobacteria bacterium]|nr:HAD hydrolase-like protein [Deltaproteobacteria bacterium]